MKVLNGAVDVVHRPADIDGLGRMLCWGISAPTQPCWSRRGGVGGGGGIRGTHMGSNTVFIKDMEIWTYCINLCGETDEGSQG